MGILDRMSRIIRANINDMLDQAEDPELMLNELLREMQSSMRQARVEVANMIAQEKEVEAELAEAQRDSSEWGKKAELAVVHGREDLAREALRRKRDAESIAEVYQHQLATQQELVTKLRQQLRVLDAKYNEAESKRTQLIARHRASQAQKRVQETFSSLPDLSAMSEMDRMEKRIRSEEARTAALAEMETSSMEWEFAELETDQDLEFELMELKARVGGDDPAGRLGSGTGDDESEPTPSLGSGPSSTS